MMGEIEGRLAELHARYRSSLPAKRERVEQAWQAFAGDPGRRGHRQELMRVLHRLAGSAPGYGYERVGALAARAEARLARAAAEPEPDPAAGALHALARELAPLVDSLLDALATESAAGPDRPYSAGS